MSSLSSWTVLVIALGASPAAESKEAKPVEVVAYFHDGTVVQKAMLEESIEITTPYGKLAVPVAEIRQIEFGHRLAGDTARKIEDAIKRLGSEQFPQREAAGKELIALGKEAYPALQQAARASDKAVVLRARAAIQKIEETIPEAELRLRTDDIIYTRECVLTGKIDVPALKARTKKFGEIKFNLADLKSVYSMATSEAEVAVEAAGFHASPDKWLDTGVVVEPGMGLVVTGSGKVDLSPGEAGTYVSEPNGYARGNMNMGHLWGTLLGRIGEKGEIFVIGKRCETQVARAGKLYVFIVPVPNGTLAPSGSYRVKATAGYGVAVGQPTGRVSAYPVPAYAPGTAGAPLPAPPVPPPAVPQPRLGAAAPTSY
jgi:hypothetical protein